MKISLLSILLIGLLPNCSNREDAVLPDKGYVTLDFELGQEKTLATKGLSNNVLDIKLVDIKDGRCTGSQCQVCYGGYLYAYFIVRSNTAHDSLSLSRVSCVELANATFDNPIIDRKDIQGLRFGLVKVSDKQSNKDKYKVQLLIADL